jgi:hypothetical protein
MGRTVLAGIVLPQSVATAIDHIVRGPRGLLREHARMITADLPVEPDQRTIAFSGRGM